MIKLYDALVKFNKRIKSPVIVVGIICFILGFLESVLLVFSSINEMLGKTILKIVEGFFILLIVYVFLGAVIHIITGLILQRKK